MKQHTQRFKEAITELGKQQSVLITYTIDNEEIILGVEEINSATPRYDADLLKSVMKELHLDSNVDIPVGTEINFKYGLLVDGVFEYLNYGNYIVYSSEKKEDTSSYEILCYDKMIYSMKEYEELAIFYPCTVRSYINAIAGKLGLDFANKNDTFVNYDKELVGDFYLSTDEETQEKKSMGYTYRDILDDLAEVTASVICINDKDELEVRYITDSINYETTEKSKELQIESKIEAPIQLVTLDGVSTQETRSGKNLFDKEISPVLNSSIAITSLDTGLRLTSEHTNTDAYYYAIYRLIDLTNYVGKIIRMKTNAIASGENTILYRIGLCDIDGGNRTLMAASEIAQSQISDTISFKVPELTEGINYLCVWLYCSAGGNITAGEYVDYKDLIITIDNSDMSYEPYGASPSPDFPSEIKSVGDDVNLFDKNTATQGYISFNNGQFTSNNTYTSSDFIEINGNENYYCNYVKFNSDSVGMAFYDKDKNYISGSQLQNSFKAPENAKYYRFCVRNENYSSGTYITDISTIKLQKGTVATAYSEYGKGTVEIKQTGKNLFNAETKTDNNGLVWANGNSFSSEKSIISDFISIENMPSIFSNYRFYIFFYDRNKTYLGNSYELLKTNGNSYKNLTFPLNENIAYFRLWYRDAVNSNIDMTTITDIMITRTQEELTDYEPYKGNNYVIPLSQPLRSLPNGVCDTIEEDGIHRRVGSVVLDGSETGWQKHSTTSAYRIMLNSIVGSWSNKTDISTHWICDNSKAYYNNHGYFAIAPDGLLWVGSEKTTLEEFKAWLSENPVTIQGELAEEVIEPFNEEQQAVIDNIQTFNGVNIISSNAELQIRYAIDQDTIDKEYLKDTNVNFGEVFGPVNAVVLSRSTSDNIYRNDVASINENGLYEIKISDNQILNQNNRDTFIQPIFDKLKGLTYGICDFNSTGIMYYDLLDRFNVKVGDNIYSTVMFHNEQNITQGLEENIYVEKPKTSETDYTKADKTDRKINQTNLIVDKQQQNITALITSNSDLVKKTAQLIIDVDKIEGEISEVADVTTTGEGYGTVELENINGDSEPIYIRVYPTNEDIISLKPKVGLYPSVGLYPHSREIHFKNTSSQEPYEVTCNIPSDLYQLNDIHDEFILKYETQECYVIHRIGINENGEKYLLETETIESFDYPVVPLTEGDYQIYTPLSNMAYIYVRLMVQNIYTTQFATKVEVNSKIEQTSNSITSSVNQTLTNYDTKTEVNSKIQQTANDITSTVSETYETKSNANSKYSEIKQTTDSISSTVSKKVGNDEIISKINQSAETVGIIADKIELSANDVLNLLAGNTINLSSKNIIISSDVLEINKYGKIKIKGNSQATDLLRIENISNSDFAYYAPDSWGIVRQNGSIYATAEGGNFANSNIELSGTGGTTNVRNTGITTPVLNQTSKEENKKNFEKLNNALDIIKDIDIYKYNLKAEQDGTKKHIGFVIGDSYNYSKEITSTENDGVDIYSLASVCLQAIQEQQELIEQLQEEIKKLKEEKIDG